MTLPRGFLPTMYRTMGFVGAAAAVIGLLVGGWVAAVNVVLGFGLLCFTTSLWHLTLHFIIRPRKTSWAKESLLVFLRYGLIGALIYAIIRLPFVDWLWFFLGCSMIVPSLLIAVLVSDRT